jgi:hypothetical protein
MSVQTTTDAESLAIAKIKSNEVTPEELDWIFRRFGYMYTTRYLLSSNPRSSYWVLTQLATDEYGSIIRNVLRNSACPREVLDYYAGEGLYLLEILRNSACPSDLLVEIYSRWSAVSGLAMRHTNFPEDLAEWSLGLERW